jgi:hypothetical protein
MTSEDIKDQLNEYHVLVAEVIGGLSADFSDAMKRLEKLEGELIQLRKEVDAQRNANLVLTREVLALKTATGDGKTGA